MVWFPASKQTHLSMNHGGHKHESERRENTRFHLILWLNYFKKTKQNIILLESAVLNHFPQPRTHLAVLKHHMTSLSSNFYKLDMLLDL